MAQSTWERLAAGSGLVFVVLFIVAVAVVNPVADPLGDEVSVVAERLMANRSDVALLVLVSVAVVVLAAFALVWFAASLRSTLRQAEGEAGVLSEVAFVGGVMAGVTLVASAALTRNAAQFMRRQNDSEGAYISASLAETMGIATFFGLALLVGATCVIAFRHRAIPRWLAWVGAVGAVLSLVPQSPILAVGGVIVLFWIAALSIVLIRRVGSTGES